MELRVATELAGVQGPCPGCGATIKSPAPKGGERPVPIKPRLPKQGVAAPARDPAKSIPGIPPKRHRHRPSRGMEPHPGRSGHGDERTELKTLVKIVVAVLLTGAIAMMVHVLLKRDFSKQDPAPVPEENLTL